MLPTMFILSRDIFFVILGNGLFGICLELLLSYVMSFMGSSRVTIKFDQYLFLLLITFRIGNLPIAMAHNQFLR